MFQVFTAWSSLVPKTSFPVAGERKVRPTVWERVAFHLAMTWIGAKNEVRGKGMPRLGRFYLSYKIR